MSSNSKPCPVAYKPAFLKMFFHENGSADRAVDGNIKSFSNAVHVGNGDPRVVSSWPRDEDPREQSSSTIQVQIKV